MFFFALTGIKSCSCILVPVLNSLMMTVLLLLLLSLSFSSFGVYTIIKWFYEQDDKELLVLHDALKKCLKSFCFIFACTVSIMLTSLKWWNLNTLKKAAEVIISLLWFEGRDITHGTTGYKIYYLRKYLKFQKVNSEVNSLESWQISDSSNFRFEIFWSFIFWLSSYNKVW